MRNIILLVTITFSIILFSCQQQTVQEPSLKNVFKDKFLFGTAVNTHQVLGKDSLSLLLLDQHFNSITAENCMKPEEIQPKQGVFTFEQADAFVDFGVKNNMTIIGHTLVWHSQCPDWFFYDSEGNQVGRDTLLQRMKKHIFVLAGRYKGKIHGWDVVNEAFEDDGSYRKTKWYTIIGEDYIQKAFEFAHEADPDAELYYNDYSMPKPGRRESVVKMVKDLQSKGVKIDGVGFQAHFSMDFPSPADMDETINMIADLGVDIHITEMDLTILPWPSNEVTAEISTRFELKEEYNPYPDGLPDSANIALTNRYFSFFKLFIDNSDKISRVTMWGITDGHTWRNNWPIRGRKDYPLLFDREYQPKAIVDSILLFTVEE